MPGRLEACVWIDGPAILSPAGGLAAGPDDLFDRGWGGTAECVWSEAGDAARGLCPCGSDYRVGRERAREQRAFVAVYRGGSAEGREAGGDRSLPDAYG